MSNPYIPDIQTNLEEYTLEKFLNIVMPAMAQINNVPHTKYKLNNITWNNIIILGGPNMGKTELGRMFMEQAHNRYLENLEPISIPRDKVDVFFNMPLLRVGKPVKFLHFDDLANKKLTERQKDNWYRFRHQVRRQAKSDNGLLITMLVTQSYYALPKVVRENFFCIIAKSTPSNMSDERLIRKLFGEEGYQLLKKQTMDILLKKPHTDIAVFNLFGTIGWFKTPLAETDYMDSCEYQPLGH
jgi:hypothetical protein